MAHESTEAPAFETMLDHVDLGQIAASVPVVYMGEECLYTTAGWMPTPQDDDDVICQAIASCMRAYREAEQDGAHPVPYVT